MTKPNHDRFVNLGDEVKDTLTGFVGICGSITEYLNGCRRIMIVPPVDATGKYQDERWIDEPQLEVIKRSAYIAPIRPKLEAPKDTGGDRPDPPALP